MSEFSHAVTAPAATLVSVHRGQPGQPRVAVRLRKVGDTTLTPPALVEHAGDLDPRAWDFPAVHVTVWVGPSLVELRLEAEAEVEFDFER